MATKKYVLTENTKEVDGRTLHQIQALIDIPEHGVKAGDLGGWIESESNLSHYGKCWVAGNAYVFDEACVRDHAYVYGDAWVFGNARVFDNALVCGNTLVHGNACVFGNARVYGDAWVRGNARVYGNAEVFGDARIPGVDVIFF